MIGPLLPDDVASYSLMGDALRRWHESDMGAAAGRGVDESWPEFLTRKRRREFYAGRECIAQAFRTLGVRVSDLEHEASGAPVWPFGFTGSVTHCRLLVSAAVASTSNVLAIGIDAEPNLRLPDGVLGLIARPREIELLSQLHFARGLQCDRLLYSAKECVFKMLSARSVEAWSPRALQLREVRTDGSLAFEVTTPTAIASMDSLTVRFRASDRVLATACWFRKPKATSSAAADAPR